MNCAWPPSRCGATTIRRANVAATLAPNSLADDVQAGVEARRRAGRGDDRPVVEVQHVALDLRPREALLELVDVAPVGRADAGRRAAPPRPSTKAPAHTDSRRAPRASAARSASITSGRHRLRHAASRACRSGRRPSRRSSPCSTSRRTPGRLVGTTTRLGSADRRSRSWEPLVEPVEPPGLAEHSELERGDSVVDEDGDVVQGHSPDLAESWQEIEVLVTLLPLVAGLDAVADLLP